MSHTITCTFLIHSCKLNFSKLTNKFDQCNILKSKVDDLQYTLHKFTKERDNWNCLLGNQRTFYNKSGLGYKPKNKSKELAKFIMLNQHLNAKS